MHFQEGIKAARERGRRMAAARWKKDRERRDREMPDRLQELAEIEVMNLPRRNGDALGGLQWSDFRTGRVRRWVVRIGNRADRIFLEAPDGRRTGSRGWTWVLAQLRGFLAGRKAGG